VLKHGNFTELEPQTQQLLKSLAVEVEKMKSVRNETKVVRRELKQILDMETNHELR
jgi:hypothetical protein